MKHRSIWISMAAVLMVTISCGSAGNGEKNSEETSGTEHASVRWPWNDVPAYPETKAGGMKEWEDLAIEMKYEEVQGRYFETPDKVGQVHAFYQSEMPKRGWTGGEHSTAREDFSSVRWKQTGKEVMASITVSTDPDGNVRVMIVRAEGLK